MEDKKMYRIIIAGCRYFEDYESLKKMAGEVIESIRIAEPEAKIMIVSGGANGADKLGERFAKENGFDVKVFPANWTLYGKSAGPVRNREMLMFAKEQKGILIAFWDGVSRGTANMIKISKDAGIPVFIFNFS